MSSSSFLYDWENVSNAIKKIYEIINLNESMCDLYTMDYIYQSPTHCSKVNLEYVQKYTKFPGKLASGYMFETNWSYIEHLYKKLGKSFNKKRGKNKRACPMFDNDFSDSSKKTVSHRLYFFNQTGGHMLL